MQSQETSSSSSVSVQKRVERYKRAGSWIEIREMLTKDDLLQCEGLFRRAHQELIGETVSFDMGAIVRHADYKLADPERLWYNGWIAYREGEPIGFLIGSLSSFYYSFDTMTRLDVWYVDRKARGSAAAFLLLKRLIQWGALRGAIRTILDIVVDKHTPAQQRAFENMATKLGFRKAGAFFVRDFDATRVDDKRS